MAEKLPKQPRIVRRFTMDNQDELDKLIIGSEYNGSTVSIFKLGGDDILVRIDPRKDAAQNNVLATADELEKNENYFRSIRQIPKFGEKLICYFCSSDRLESVLGDQEEEFMKLSARFGAAHARRIYYWRVACIAADAILRQLERVASLKGKLGL